MNARELSLKAEGVGRLDVILTELAPELSRSRWQRLIKAGEVRVDGEVVTKPAQEITGGEQIKARIPPPKQSHLQPESIPLDIIYEDNHILVVNKPAGMVVHPAAGHQTGTLVHAALAHAPDIQGVGGLRRPGIVHRLDKDTSGVIVMAKDDQAHQNLQAQFKKRSVRKEYLALVDGRPPTPSGRIEAPIGRDPRHRQRMAVLPGQGRPSTTVYHTEQNFRNHSLLRVYPETGRTHQIRVHLAFLKCPVVGDTTYGRRSASLEVERQLLHAASLRFRPPGENEEQTFEAPLPGDFQRTLEALSA
ncbi:MAG: RluA family pseudouridine synthase [Anaerolineales bacterium]